MCVCVTVSVILIKLVKKLYELKPKMPIFSANFSSRATVAEVTFHICSFCTVTESDGSNESSNISTVCVCVFVKITVKKLIKR